MAMARWDPFRDLESMREFMDRLMERGFEGRSQEGLETSTVALPLDIWETNEAVYVQASVPGVRSEDLDIRVEGNVLTVRGQVTASQEVKEENVLRRERRFGRFFRQIALPTPVQADKAEAHFENGVVTITLPKVEAARPKSIPVRTTAARKGEKAA